MLLIIAGQGETKKLDRMGKGVIICGMDNPAPIAVIKNDHTGREVWRYEGIVLERSPTHVMLEAYFDTDDRDAGYTVFQRGDRFVEYHYSDRWYSIFEVHAVDDDHLKGWYCNFSRPAQIGERELSIDDLALDLFVYPDGQALILDQEEFDTLPISQEERAAVMAALEELQRRAREKLPPFSPEG